MSSPWEIRTRLSIASAAHRAAAFGLFREHFPEAKMVVLGKNRRSTTTILKSAFALVSKNPDVFPPGQGPASRYHRSPLISAREEEASRDGRFLPSPPVDAVVLAAKEFECSDLVAAIRDRQRKSRCKWSDFAILYRQHFHREPIVAEMAEQGIPFAIENMDVVDTPEARDLFACLGAVVSVNDSASLFRVASFPQFAIDPEKLRAGIKAIPRDERRSGVASVLAKIENGAAVLNALQQVRDEVSRAAATSSGVLNIIIRHFGLSRTSPAIAAVLGFVKRWEEKPEAITKTGDIGEFIDYLQYFRTAGGVIPISTGAENAVRLMTAHVAKGLEFNHVFIIRANSNSFPSSYKEPLVDFPRELQGSSSIRLLRRQGNMPAGGATAVLCCHDASARFAHHLRSTRARQRSHPGWFSARSAKGSQPEAMAPPTSRARVPDRLVCRGRPRTTRIARDRMAQVAASA